MGGIENESPSIIVRYDDMSSSRSWRRLCEPETAGRDSGQYSLRGAIPVSYECRNHILQLIRFIAIMKVTQLKTRIVS